MTDMDSKTWAGAAFYTRGNLRLYEPLILLNCRVLWRCPRSRLIRHYDEHVSRRHLDIGVGDGSIIDACSFPVADPSVTLMDLNENSLASAAERIRRYRPSTHRGNVLDRTDMPAGRFDSVGMMFLLHCLPGDMASKAVAFQNAHAVLEPGGKLFGATVVNGGVRQTAASRIGMAALNSRGHLCNLDDGIDALKAGLDASFPDNRVTVVGSVALFSATRDAA